MKVAGLHVFFCEYCESFKNTFLYRTTAVAAPYSPHLTSRTPKCSFCQESLSPVFNRGYTLEENREIFTYKGSR